MRLLELKSADIDLITEVNGVKDYGLFVALLEATQTKKRLVEELEQNSVEQLTALEKFSAKPTVGEKYRAILLYFTGGKFVRLLGKKHFRTLVKVDNGQLTFEDGEVFPDKRITDLSYSKAFLFDNDSVFKKFMMMLSLSFEVKTDLSESYLKEAVDPKLGRAFNHLEDLVFFYGSKGTIEALEHLKDMNTEQGSGSVRMKWDGCLHEDTIVKTSVGDITIKDLIVAYGNDKTIKVYGCDLKNNIDTTVDILGTSVSSGIKPWVEIELENGSTLILTEDHEVYTSNRGWVAAGKLTIDDDIVEMK